MREAVLRHMKHATIVNFIGFSILTAISGDYLLLICPITTLGIYLDLKRALNKYID